ncbi:MAG: DUF2442 domain-containing protein [Gemmatimonadota bacterium]
MTTKRLSDAELERQIDQAEVRALYERAEGLWATAVRYDRAGHRLVLTLANGYVVGVPRSALPHLAGATGAQLATVELGADGITVRVPALDADYSVRGLVQAMTAAANGKRGGASKSDAKQLAAKANGAKGGRPRKTQRV